jgi:PKD repeat protein
MEMAMTRHLLATMAVWIVAALAACGGDNNGGGAPAPANNAPQAAFDAAANGAAGAALAFDASGSSDADGDALTYSWSFGDGTHGGGAQLAHVFDAGGTYTVTLTVADGRGGTASSTRDITVSAPPALSAPAASVAQASDANGPLPGVTVAVLGTSASAVTGSDGKAPIGIATGAAVTLRFSKPGYADQFKRVQMPAGAAGTQVAVQMLPREAALTLADASAGGTLAGKHGATLVVPPNALVDGAGNPVTGAVQVALTPVDVAADVRNFPGQFQGLRASGARGLIESYGTVEFVPTQNGAPLQVAPGRTVTIDIPIYTGLHRDGSAVAAGQQVPLWSLDERSAAWVQEGVGTVVASASSPSGFVLRADVGHLSWWNCDQWLGAVPEGSYNPNVKCCIRDTPNGACKENSGDICEHTGSGPSGGGGGSAALQRALGLARSQQAGSSLRVPAVAAFATAPAVAGAVLPMPADMDITLESTARNGTYRGVTVVRGGAGVSEDVTVSVLPVASGGGDEPITLPWSQDYAVQSVGEVDRFKLTLPAGPGFEVTVSRSGSTLGGTVKVSRPGGAVVATQNFGASAAYIAENTVAGAGEYTIEVTAGSNAPGAYKLEVVSFGTCAGTQTLTLPFNQTVSLGPNQSRCLDVALAADDVIQVEPGQTGNNIAGSVSLSTAGGVQQISAHAYPGAAPIASGVSLPGTYRVRVTNTTMNSGTLELVITKPAVQVLNVPGSVTLNNMGPGAAEQLVLIKPPADGLYHVALAATNLQAGVQVEPAGTSFVTGCSACGSPNTTSDARALRNVAPALPVARVFRNSGSGNTVALSAGVPTLINRDTDIDGASAAGLRVYAFDANAGEVVSFGFARPESSSDVSMLSVYRPSGAVVGGNSAAHTLAESGLHTALVTPLGASTGAYTLRINTPPPVQALSLAGPPVSMPFDLPLGQVLRYSTDLAQGELVGLGLATPGALNVQAAFGATVIEGHAETPSSGSGPFNVTSPPRFTRSAGPVTLTVRSTTNALERARGNGNTLVVHKPAPTNAAINVTQSGNLAAGGWTAYRYTVAAAGSYQLRVQSSAGAPYALAATVWAASSPLANYSGEFTSGAASGFPPTEASGPLAAGTYTVTVRNNLATAPGAYELILVPVSPP